MHPRSSTPWRPLLDGDLAAAAGRALEDILARLSRQPMDPQPTLDRGAGRALLFGYAHQALPDRGYDEQREAALDDVVERLASTTMHPSLIEGFVGTAWVVDHLADDEDEDPVAAIDDALVDALAVPQWMGEFDLLYGLAGVGVYALSRLPRPGARACLERVVAHLASLAEPRPSGVAWRTRRHWRPASPDRLPEDFDLGVAHGTPAVVTVLAGAVAAGVARAQAEPLLAAALAWLWANQRSDGPSAFGTWEYDGVTSTPARLAWCYGDAGVATATYAAVRAVGDEAAAARALAIARASTARSRESARVKGTGLCHGAAGLALLYARMANASGDAVLAAASRYWYADLIAQLQRESLVEGHATFLVGAVGVALALLAGVSPIEPRWDVVLAASLP